jgi:hypothetical protein
MRAEGRKDSNPQPHFIRFRQLQNEDVGCDPFPIRALFRRDPNLGAISQGLRGAAHSLRRRHAGGELHAAALNVHPAHVAASSRNVDELACLVLGSFDHPSLEDAFGRKHGNCHRQAKQPKAKPEDPASAPSSRI